MMLRTQHMNNLTTHVLLSLAAVAWVAVVKAQAPPGTHGIIVEGTECLESNPITAWGKNVVEGITRRGLTTGGLVPNANSPLQEPNRALRSIFKRIQQSLADSDNRGSRIGSCGWESTGEYASIFNCHNFPHPLCPKTTDGWLAVYSNPTLDNQAGNWHFYDWIPTNSFRLEYNITFLGKNDVSFDPRLHADWFRSQKALVEESGCGYAGWFGVSTSRAGDGPVPVVQYTRPILRQDKLLRVPLCGEFVGVCAAGVALPPGFLEDTCDIEIDPIIP